MINRLRLPTMRQLEKMGSGDAGAVLDYQESEYKIILGQLTDPNDRRRIRKAIRRVQKRRDEFFGDN